MNTKDKLSGISKSLYFLLILFIPLNLGKHFETTESYVGGILVDYLIPTVFIQDIISFLVILFWIFSGGLHRLFKIKKDIFEKREVQLSTLFIFSLFISTLVAVRFVPSIYAWLRVFLYFLLFLYSLIEIPVEDNFFKIVDLISISILLLSILGIAQFINKGSVFNNYLILGEQPYSAAVFGVPKEYLFGKAVVPSYGLFRHPNILGGYLAITLVWLFSFLKRRKFYLIVFLLGIATMFFTFSYSSWLVFAIGIVFHLFLASDPKKIKERKKIAIYFVLVIFFLSLSLPFIKLLGRCENLSVVRRVNFTKASYRIIKDNFLFGLGINNLTIFIDRFNTNSPDMRFLQPVHNIFLLIFSEAGVFAFLLFISFIWYSLKRLLNSSYFHIFLISVLQIILLGCFDHYLFTIHQTLLLFWIIFGLALQ